MPGSADSPEEVEESKGDTGEEKNKNVNRNLWLKARHYITGYGTRARSETISLACSFVPTMGALKSRRPDCFDAMQRFLVLSRNTLSDSIFNVKF